MPGLLFHFFKNHNQDIEVEIKKRLQYRFLNTIEDLFSSTWIEDKAFPDFFYTVGDGIRVMSSSFIQSMKRSFAFVGSDEFRPAIGSILLNVKKEYIDIVSTDMFRLFINRKECANALEERSIMISKVAASILYRFSI